MKRILLGTVTIVGALAAMYIGVTGAFFSDTETSTGNTFAAGAIDLLVDNESYYNGNVCAETAPDSGIWQWQGNALFPVPGTECDTSWELDNLTGHLFFNFTDIKPDDEGEDTISLHVNTNDAYMCMNIALTENDDNNTTEPEGLVDPTANPDTEWDGELAQTLQMVWWADDSDNVLEHGETILTGDGTVVGGVETLFNLASTSGPFVVALADSENNVWDPQNPGPVPGEETRYIGKAWCFGTLTISPVPFDTGVSPAVDPGVLCDGTLLGNETQTDSALLDVTFDAVQARNNPDFVCLEDECTFNEQVDLLVATAKFENPEVTTAQNWDVFGSPVDGWNVDWRGDIPATFGPQNRPAVANLEYHEGVLGAAFEGDQYAELDSDWGGPSDAGTGEPASVSIYRNFVTVPGAQYLLKYHFSPRPNTPAADNNLEAKVEGVALNTTGPTAGGGAIAWSEIVLPFIAGDASTEIRFTDLGTANSLGTFLDNVRLYQISCPVVQ